MQVMRIEGATRVLGAGQGYAGLPVRDDVIDGFPVMVSSWEPSPAEIEALKLGSPIYLWVLGAAHPLVRITTGPAPGVGETA